MQRSTMLSGLVISLTNEKIPFNETFPMISQSISEMLQNDPEPSKPVEIPLLYDTETIKRCIEFCRLYNDDKFIIFEEPIKTTDILPKWCDDLFYQMDLKTICNLIKIADFLAIDMLINVMCVKLAALMKGQSPEKIREIWANIRINLIVGPSSTGELAATQTQTI